MNKLRCWLAGCLLLSGVTAQAAKEQGELGWLERVALSVPVSGVVASVPVSIGQAVERGEQLLSLDLSVFQAKQVAAAAHVKATEGLRGEAQRELERAQELYERTVLSDRDLQLAELDFDKADAEYQSARAALAQTKFDLQHAQIKAPFAGWVVAVNVSPGEVLIQEQEAKSLVTVARRDVMQVSVTLNAEQLSAIKMGDRLPVVINGSRYEGTVTTLGLEAVQGRYPLALRVSVPEGERWLAGQMVEVEVP